MKCVSGRKSVKAERRWLEQKFINKLGLFFFLQRHMRDNAKGGLHCRSGCASLRMVGYSPLGRWELATCVGISGAVTVGARLDLTACPPGGPSVGCSPPCLGPTGSVACSACVPGDWHAYEGCGTCWGWPGACSERECGIDLEVRWWVGGKFLIH